MVWSDLLNFKIKYKLGVLKKVDFTEEEFEFYKEATQCTQEQINEGERNHPGGQKKPTLAVKQDNGSYENQEVSLKNWISLRSGFSWRNKGWRQNRGKLRESYFRMREGVGNMLTSTIPALSSTISLPSKIEEFIKTEGSAGEGEGRPKLGQQVKSWISSKYQQDKSREKILEMVGTTIQVLNMSTWTDWGKKSSNDTGVKDKPIPGGTNKDALLYEWQNYAKVQQLVQRGATFLSQTLSEEERGEYGEMISPHLENEDPDQDDFKSELDTLYEVITEDRAGFLQRKMTSTKSPLSIHHLSSYIPGTRKRGEFVSDDLSPTAKKLGILNKMAGLVEQETIKKLYFTKDGQPLDVIYNSEGDPIGYMENGKKIDGEPPDGKYETIESKDGESPKTLREVFMEEYGDNIDKFYESNLNEDEQKKLKEDRGNIIEPEDYKTIAREEFNQKTKHAYFNGVEGSAVSTDSGGGRTGSGFNLIGEQSHHLLTKSLMGTILEAGVKVATKLRLRNKDGNLVESPNKRLQDREYYAPNAIELLVMMNEEFHQELVHNVLETSLQFHDHETMSTDPEGNRVNETDPRTLFLPQTIQVPDGVDDQGNVILWRQYLTPDSLAKFLEKHPNYINKVENLKNKGDG